MKDGAHTAPFICAFDIPFHNHTPKQSCKSDITVRIISKAVEESKQRQIEVLEESFEVEGR
jgi:hypothetical protein